MTMQVARKARKYINAEKLTFKNCVLTIVVALVFVPVRISVCNSSPWCL